MSAFVFVEVCGYVCAPISVVSNVLLLLVVRSTTSRHLIVYKMYFNYVATCNIILSIAFLLSQPCVLTDREVILVVLLGPAILVHSVLTSICFVVFLATMIMCSTQIASPYYFKMMNAKEGKTLGQQILVLLVAQTVVYLVILFPLVYFSFQSATELRDRTSHYQRFVREYTNFDYVPQYVVYQLNTIGKVWLILVVLICASACVSVAVRTMFSSGLLGISRWSNQSLSARFGQIANTARMNACSMAVLIVLPLLLFSIFAVSGWPTYSYSIPLFLGAAFMPILTAVVITTNVRTFRKTLSAILTFRPKVNGPISHISSDQ